MSCLKLQASFSLNFASLFSLMKDNSTVQTLVDLSDANASEIEQFIDVKFDKIITDNTDKKITSLLRNIANKACQANFDEINIETCHRSGCLVLQNKIMTAEIKGDK